MKIIPLTETDLDFAHDLAQRLQLPINDDDAVLMVASPTLSFLRRLTPPVIEWTIDFASPEYQQSFAARGRQKDPLARALGLHKKQDLDILDMTAGLGKDALWMAHCGASVTLIERHPALAYLLEQAIIRASQTNMQVHCCSAQEYLNQVEARYDVAYYDPMFEPRKKSALVKKDMQIMQALHGDERPDPGLITLALQHADKVVVKRAKADPPLLPNPHHAITTTVTRFDVYTAK